MLPPQLHRELGLKDEELERIVHTLGREPTVTELAMFSVEWSEHCGYPRSRELLKLLPREGKYATRAEGEDAGGIDLGDGWMVLFKMESHNHPSQIEPKQGAATGVGGIVRDIFTMGARPIACLDSLRFGPLSNPHTRYLLHGVVDGIQFYGNCLGIPTVAGEVYFHDAYRGNCLVNVMCVGVARTDRIISSRARGAGNPVMMVGNRTGRDGIGGASILASHEFGESDEKRPTVQIGDPFTEKCLIEACLEAVEHGGLVGLKDMGAAGITCTTAEMSAAGHCGMDIDLQLVPRREAGMEPWELMMSESQERMLVVTEKGREDEISAIFRKWGLHAVIIGQVTDDGLLTVRDDGEVVARIDAQALAEAPIYQMPIEEPSYLTTVRKLDLASVPLPKDYNLVMKAVLGTPNIACKEWVYYQYDHMVQTNTVVAPGSDAAVLRIKGTGKGIALATDCNPRYCYLDPYLGAQIAVAEAARNVICAGADPAGVTDCLNFGNPEKPDRFWQFRQCILGVVEACTKLRVPVVSGNVSFYNETPDSVVFPTPEIGMVGVLADIERRGTADFKQAGDTILLVGRTGNELGGSEYLSVSHRLERGVPPALDLDFEQRVQSCCLEAIRSGLVSSAHDCSDGGLAITLAESCISGRLGAEIALPTSNDQGEKVRPDAWLFGESQSRIVLSAPAERAEQIQSLAQQHHVPAAVIGKVGGERLVVSIAGAGEVVNLPVAELDKIYRETIPKAME